MLATFARAHPDLFVGVNLDPDSYLNPFFEERQWYDYNPGTLRQFRHWLAGSGPYAGRPDAPGVPDLSAYRRARPLSLAEVIRTGRTATTRAGATSTRRARFRARRRRGARRSSTTRGRANGNASGAIWCELHYDELARWLVDAGIPRERIWSSQGFMAPHEGAQPFAVRLDSPTKNYDTGGMSVEGAKPRDGHLGAILYGPAAANAIRMEGPLSAVRHAARRRSALGGGRVQPCRPAPARSAAGYATAYRGFTARRGTTARVFVSPMAWNGSNGALRRHSRASSPIPRGSTRRSRTQRRTSCSRAPDLSPRARLWTFGAAAHADADGWRPTVGRSRRGPATSRWHRRTAGWCCARRASSR